MTESTHWTAVEFADIDLGDARLDSRARKIVARFADKPSSSISKSCNGWAETIATYRFLENDAVEWRDIMVPHWAKTQQRMGEHPVILCLQDTTELNFNGQQIEGLGPLSYEVQRGMYVHPTYAVTPERLPLGVIDAWMWAREKIDGNGVRPGIKESGRWIEGYGRIAEMAAEMPATRLVYVADREADMIELMTYAQDCGTPADWLVRAKTDRALPDGEKLWAHTLDGAPVGEISFVIGARGKQKGRKVRQQLWTRRVELPARRGVKITATCVIAREIDAPAGIEPIEWRLLTNRTATTVDAVIELIDWYRARWEIEMFFHVLKNACKVEAMQLSHIDNLERALALFMVVAWRVSYLMRIGRICPDLDASLFFDPDEIRGAYLLTKERRPDQPPTLNDVVRLIARVGGFLGRKGDGDPGVKTIWQGIQDVRVAALTIKALRDEAG
ncbi:IS4 family transposase [Janthinobacterium sp. PC23-8]|uniref:IS4 family transposase n=1 Tax=Janthinobacterium sp. PC23-8 TaxID=2012679 RepID=UPI000B96B3D0|nr:IS4 family transposase [Janthinobacterium sp. PC23-8]OYO28920.1 IS4 family transposase [Janthinobacterium sp. PC23-8]